MFDLEKVINGLECCTQPSCECANDCPYSHKAYIYQDCRDVLMADALALLKAQEPRVMTLEEASNSTVPMWFEKSGDECGWITGIDCSPIQAATIGQVDGDDWYNLPINDYGRLWRCWTSRPTDAQRENVKWE